MHSIGSSLMNRFYEFWQKIGQNLCLVLIQYRMLFFFQHRLCIPYFYFQRCEKRIPQIYLCVCLSLRSPVRLCHSPPVRPSIYVSACVVVQPSICSSVCASACLSVRLFMCLTMCLCVRLSVCLSHVGSKLFYIQLKDYFATYTYQMTD